jgi:hypothetical protein
MKIEMVSINIHGSIHHEKSFQFKRPEDENPVLWKYSEGVKTFC